MITTGLNSTYFMHDVDDMTSCESQSDGTQHIVIARTLQLMGSSPLPLISFSLVVYAKSLQLILNMSHKIWILVIFGFAISLDGSSAKLCVRRYVNGKWISKGDCGGPGRMSEMQKEVQRKIEDENKCIAGKGWTVFQRRVNGDEDFYRDWDDYKKGFGDCDGDMWLGLEELHEATKEGDMELEINMITKHSGIHWVAKYSNFRIGPHDYRLNVSGYSGNSTGDALSYSNHIRFSTKDAERADWPPRNCASRLEGGWWYRRCAHTNLNGNFNKTGETGFWWRGSSNLLRFSGMKFRKRPDLRD